MYVLLLSILVSEVKKKLSEQYFIYTENNFMDARTAKQEYLLDERYIHFSDRRLLMLVIKVALLFPINKDSLKNILRN